MRNKIQRNMVFMIVLTLLASYAFIIGIVYNQTYRIMRQDARQEAAYIKEAINLLGSQYLQEMDDVNTDTRVTQIDEEGTVLYDSHGINSKDENHAQRKEIKEALEKGHGQAKRMSETVGQELYYYATLLEDGTVLRVAKSMDGVSSTAATRSTSHRLYSTAARRGRLASSFASTQGAVSSMYLLARWMTLKISASAFGTCRTSMHAVTFAGRASTMAASSSSSGSALRWAGRVPPKYF